MESINSTELTSSVVHMEVKKPQPKRYLKHLSYSFMEIVTSDSAEEHKTDTQNGRLDSEVSLRISPQTDTKSHNSTQLHGETQTQI
jgi:hypothetical protein